MNNMILNPFVLKDGTELRWQWTIPNWWYYKHKRNKKWEEMVCNAYGLSWETLFGQESNDEL